MNLRQLFEIREDESAAEFAKRCAYTGLIWTIIATIGLALIICGLTL